MKNMRILGVDLGDARTGLAVSDPTGFLAGGIGVIQSKWDVEIARQVAMAAEKYEVSCIVLGNPVNMNGSQGERCEKICAFRDLLRTYTKADIVLFDERLSTCEAHRFLNETGTHGKKRKGVVDTLSAQIILQDYLDLLKKERGRNES